MDASDTKAVVLGAGISEELILAISAVAETTTVQGTPRYSRPTIELLRRALVCRNFARPIYELCHLVNALDACGGREGYIGLLFEGTASAPAFKGRVEQALARGRGFRRGGVERTAQGLALHYRDGIFQVSWTRMPFLTALIEFIAGVLSFAEIDAKLREMLTDPNHIAAVQRAANRVASLLNRYLGQHLESESNAARLRHIVEFLSRRGGDELTLDDEAVLAFWCEQCKHGDNELGFRAFRATFKAFVALYRTLLSGRARQAAEASGSLDMPGMAVSESDDQIDEGEDLDPEKLWDRLEAVTGEWTSPLDDFAEPPVDQVKFFTQREHDELELLMHCGPQGCQFPLSVLRSDVFGTVQARLPQALRRRAPAAEMLTLTDAVDAGYEDRRTAYVALEEHVRQLQKASLHVLRRSQQDGTAAPVIDLVAARAAEQAFKSFARQGFRDFNPEDADRVEAFRRAAEPLVKAGAVLRNYLEVLARLDRGEPRLSGWLEADRIVFRDCFRQIYGVVP